MGIFNSYRKNKENQSDTNSSKGNKPKLKEIKRTYSSADINSDIKIEDHLISENKNTKTKENKKDKNENKKDSNENKIIEKTNNENNNDINKNLKIDENIQKDKDINKNETSNKTVKQGKKTLSKSYSYYKNENDNIYTRPNYSTLYDDMNIFKLILIMVNNISLAKKYFLKESAEKKIKLASEYFKKNCLSSLTYNINKSLWYDEKTHISDQDLVKEYNDYILYFTKKYCNNSNSDKFLYDEKNVEIILNSIYENINYELTCAKKGKVNDNSINTNNKFDDLKNFQKNLMEKNQSFLSDIFMGTYKFNIFCQECYLKTMNEKVQFKGSLRYETFYFVDFNFDEIKTFYANNNMYIDNFKLNDFFNCFKKVGMINSNCKTCNKETVNNEFRSILTLPDILTLTLLNNNDLNFILEEDLKIKLGNIDYVYKIVSFLCVINGKFICYCINPNNGLWYCYENKKITKVEKYDIEAKPIVIIYQKKITIVFQYNSIKRDDSKILLNIRFLNGIREQSKLYFNKNIKIEKVIRKIKTKFNLENMNLVVLINGKKSNNDDLLDGKSDNITVITE
jgi:hypothetical protein